MSGDSYLVARRSPAAHYEGDEDEVVTSAAPLDLALKRKPATGRPPLPPLPPRGRPATLTGNEPPGHIAAAAASIPPKNTAGGARAQEALSDLTAADASPAESERTGTVIVSASEYDRAAQMPPLPEDALRAPPQAHAAPATPAFAPTAPHAPPAFAPTAPHAPPAFAPTAPHGAPQAHAASVVTPALAPTSPVPREAEDAPQRPRSPAEPTLALALEGEEIEELDLALDEEAADVPPAPMRDATHPGHGSGYAPIVRAPVPAPPGALAADALVVEAPASEPGNEGTSAEIAAATQLHAPARGTIASSGLAAQIAQDPSRHAAAYPAGTSQLTGQDLMPVEAFADLPDEMHDELARAARVVDLAPDEELSGFGAALVLSGNASVCATIADTPAARAVINTLVPSRGSLAEGIPLRVVACEGGARVAVWNQTIIDDALRTCPWVLDELRAAADRLQCLAGATMGPLGELDEPLRRKILDRLRVRSLDPGQQFIAAGNPMPGLVIVGVGTLDLVDERSRQIVSGALPGELLFVAALLAGEPVPAIACAPSSGALVLLGEHAVLRELFESTPELLSVLAQAASLLPQRHG